MLTNAAGAGGGAVDDVVAGREHADELQGGQLRKRVGGERHLVRQHNRGLATARDDIGGGGAWMDGEIAERREEIPVQVAGIQGVAVEDDEAEGSGHELKSDRGINQQRDENRSDQAQSILQEATEATERE